MLEKPMDVKCGFLRERNEENSVLEMDHLRRSAKLSRLLQ